MNSKLDTESVAVNKDYIPFTGQEYLDSLNDGREVWIYGERVENITEHPAFRNSARMIARMYDALHAPETKDILTTPTEWGGFTHRFFRVAHNVEEQVASRDAIAAWQRISWGWMGRSPDYKGCFIGTLGVNADFYKGFEENARRWYRKAQEKTWFINHALMNPPVDRGLGADAGKDIFIRVVKEDEQGIYVSGAKVVATGSALTHFTFIAHVGQVMFQDPAFAPVFIVPTNAPGVKLLCRTSNEYRAAVLGSPFDYPLSSRLDENDAILVLDNVFIPWEDVFIYNNLQQANAYNTEAGYLERASLHGCTRFAVKLDFLVGTLAKALEITGADKFHGVMSQMGEVIAWRNTFWALSDAMAKSAEAWNGMIRPDPHHAGAYRVISQLAMPKIKNIIEQIVASGLIYLNSHADDLKIPTFKVISPPIFVDQMVKDAIERVKVMKMLWDAIGTEFGARHELYEINYLGSNDVTRQTNLFAAQSRGMLDYCKDFAQKAMDEYDIYGWTVPDLINPDDVSILNKINSAACVNRRTKKMTVANLQRTTLGEMVKIMQANQTDVDFTPLEFRKAMGKFATGVVVISSCHDGQTHAMTANAFMSGSLEPAMVLVSVGNSAASHEKIILGEHFGISILHEDQIQVSNHFAGKHAEHFKPEFEYIADFPVIKNAAVQVVTKLQFSYPCGDHTLFVGLVTHLQQQDGVKPLVFHSGKYAQIAG